MVGAVASFLTLAILSAPSVYFAYRYPISEHWPAIGKAFFLWLLSTTPVIAGILLSQPSENAGDVASQFQIEVLANFTISEMFVYSAAFLAPVLYVVFDIIKNYNDGDLKLDKQDLANHMRGMQWVFLSAICILILTLLAYASAKSDPANFNKTYLSLLLTGKGYIVYLASLVIWYSVILWETAPKKFSYEKSAKTEASTFSKEYAKRKGQGT
ncbi:MAG: hypothetical protein K8F59_14065 [Rhodobacteraceae bacterium]|nr:hypothetical protein [Paracoccaceae bacterium]